MHQMMSRRQVQNQNHVMHAKNEIMSGQHAANENHVSQYTKTKVTSRHHAYSDNPVRTTSAKLNAATPVRPKRKECYQTQNENDVTTVCIK